MNQGDADKMDVLRCETAHLNNLENIRKQTN